ncbi:protein Tob1-like [Liolophura sinensis]|uniref:protein Tob1-like n=1 Tax=Liolophura sinensis TaxID=3198878 RepID=UPI003158B83C
MHVEVSVALNFVISYLYNKLPRRRVNLFGIELEKGLKKKFEGHWYPERPFKGSGFRCVRVNGEQIDPVIEKAAVASGIDMEEIKGYWPSELTLWIDPAEVSYRIGEKGLVKVLYSDRKEEEIVQDAMDREIQAASRSFNPEAQCFKPIDSLSSSLNSLSLSPSSPTPSSGRWSSATSPSSTLFTSTSPVAPPSNTIPGFFTKQNIAPQFTTATFAQTKFGSTKLKTQAKRPSRLSPTEFGNFFRQRSAALQGGVQQSMPTRPRSLSPRDPRVEFYVDQQQRMIMAQHYQQQQLQQLPSPLSPSQPAQPKFPSNLGLPSTGDYFASHFSSGGLPHTNTSLGLVDLLPGNVSFPSPTNSATMSPENQKSFMDGLNLNNVSANGQYHQRLLVAN